MIDVDRLRDLEVRIAKLDDGDMVPLPVAFLRELAEAASAKAKYDERLVVVAGGEEWAGGAGEKGEAP